MNGKYGELSGRPAPGKTVSRETKTAPEGTVAGKTAPADTGVRAAGIRALLPPKLWESFDGIEEQRILGATRHAELIGEFLEAIAQETLKNGENAQVMAHRLRLAANYFIETRGEASQAVANAVRLMTRNLEALKTLRTEEARDTVIRDVKAYRESSRQSAARVTEYGKRLASGMERILLFDYSSTVEKMLAALSEDGRARTLYIAESRLIGGGKPYLKSCLSCGYQIHFIPDAALWYALRQCDGVFMGAETIFPDGTCFNTIGSDIVGLLCRHCHVPLYFLSPLIKLDFRPLEGIGKRLVQNGLGPKVRAEFEELRIDIGAGMKTRMETGGAVRDVAVEFAVPELVGVRPEFIEAVVTEAGVIPPHGMYEVSLRYRESVAGRT